MYFCPSHLRFCKMASRIHRARGIPASFPRLFAGNYLHKIISNRRFSIKVHPVLSTVIRRCNTMRFPSQEEILEDPSATDLLSFIESAWNEIEGPHHYWLNYTGVQGPKQFYFLLALPTLLGGDGYLYTDHHLVAAVEKAKLFQQKYPGVFIFGIYSGTSATNNIRITQMIMEEYITFPILLSNRYNSEAVKRPCFVLFKDLKSSFRCFDSGVDGLILIQAIEEAIVENQGKPVEVSIFKDYRCDQNEVVRELKSCTFMRNSLLHFPGCISADECGNRLFLSDCNHHRILVIDGHGRILDCIGSSPGFEDGEFESAKIARPASSFYHAEENCLYFVDSENHGIRKADLEKRVVETLHPSAGPDNTRKGLWGWVMDKLGFSGDSEDRAAARLPGSLVFPWHMIISDEARLFVINRGFDKLWVVDISSGEIKEFIQGFSEILGICGEMITEKLSTLRQIQEGMGSRAPPGFPVEPGLVSSFASFGDYIALCDTVGHRVLKICRKSQNCVDLQFSQLGRLGMPYWAVSPLENISSGFDEEDGSGVHRFHFSNLLPGKVDLKVVIDIPAHTELAEPLTESPVWIQTRGAAAEVSSSTSVPQSDKVGVAQQWYNAMDSLAFSDSETEDDVEEVSECTDKPEHPLPCIDCSVHTSPGTSEVVVSVALYLKGVGQTGGRIFIEPVQVRVRLDCLHHEKAGNLWEIRLTDSSLLVNVSLN